MDSLNKYSFFLSCTVTILLQNLASKMEQVCKKVPRMASLKNVQHLQHLVKKKNPCDQNFTSICIQIKATSH